MPDTARLKLPLIAAAQAQKHVTHNEALTALDTLVQLAVLDKDLAAPPGSPAEGDCYIVAASPGGAWTGWAGRVARFQDGQWRSFLPGAGWTAWVEDEAQVYVRAGAAWAPVSAGLGLGSAAFVDHAAGGWTPAMTFTAPGNLSVAYAAQNGSHVRIGSLVFVVFALTFTPTYTTASGQFRITGLPFAAQAGFSSRMHGQVTAGNANLAWPSGCTSIYLSALEGSTQIAIAGESGGAAPAPFAPAQFPSGTQQVLYGSLTYRTAA